MATFMAVLFTLRYRLATSLFSSHKSPDLMGDLCMHKYVLTAIFTCPAYAIYYGGMELVAQPNCELGPLAQRCPSFLIGYEFIKGRTPH